MLFSKVSNTTEGFELIGSVSPEKPSGIFRTHWNTPNEKDTNTSTTIPSFGLHNSFSSFPEDSFTTISTSSTVTFGISIEPIETIQNLEITKKGVEDRVVDVAKKIAMNLFNYLQSFDDVNSSNRNGMMMVPTNVFERWMTRFQNKYRLDPNFFMKTES